MKKAYGYDTYHGRGALRTVLKWLLIILLVGALLMGGAFLFLQQYLVRTEDGAKLVLPFWSDRPAAQTPAMPSPTGTPQLIITTPTPPPAPAYTHAMPLPLTALTNGTALSQLAATGGNAMLFDMKTNAGTLSYTSGLPLALEIAATGADPALNPAIAATNAVPEAYTIARVSCFGDKLLANARQDLAILTNSGYRWSDPQKLRWTSPTSPDVRAYLAGVCGELAGLGFDEILLDYAGYPTTGNLHYIKVGPAYDKAALGTVIDGFYAEVRAALAPYPAVKLSVVTTPEALNGQDILSGQTVQALAAHATRVYLVPNAAAGDATAMLTTAGMKNAAENVVALREDAGDDASSWAEWPQF